MKYVNKNLPHSTKALTSHSAGFMLRPDAPVVTRNGERDFMNAERRKGTFPIVISTCRIPTKSDPMVLLANYLHDVNNNIMSNSKMTHDNKSTQHQ